jgi:hypothetical protein
MQPPPPNAFLQPHVLLLVQHDVWTNGMQLFEQWLQPPPLLDPPPELADPELLPPPELLVDEPLLEPDPIHVPPLHVWPACVQSLQLLPPIPQYMSICIVWQVPLLSQHPLQFAVEQAPASLVPVGASWPESSPDPDEDDDEVVASSPLPDEDPPYDELLDPPDDAAPLDAAPDPDPAPEAPPEDAP